MEIQILEFLESRLGCEPFKWGFYTGWLIAVLYIYFIGKVFGGNSIFTFDLLGFIKK